MELNTEQDILVLVDTGRHYVLPRFAGQPDIQRILREAEIVVRSGLNEVAYVEPPTFGQQGGRIVFDPEYVRSLARDHRYPGWVISAKIEQKARAVFGLRADTPAPGGDHDATPGASSANSA